jgi:menaquinone-dependent protoporphyrinogen oxidase
MDTLIAYATKHGSTKEVAEEIAATMSAGGTRVQLCEARTVRRPITGRDLVVVGGPLYSGRLHRDVRRFLKRHKELAGVPVAVFAMGPRTDTEDAWHRSYAQLDGALAKLSWLHPVAVTVFGGVDPPGHVHPHRDLRDWPAIRQWAARVANQVSRRA